MGWGVVGGEGIMVHGLHGFARMGANVGGRLGSWVSSIGRILNKGIFVFYGED